MPNHPHPTTALNKAGSFAPCIPNAPRTSTGKGAPYFVPICAEASKGIVTKTLAKKTHHAASETEAPKPAKHAAKRQAGTHTTKPGTRKRKESVSSLGGVDCGKWEICILTNPQAHHVPGGPGSAVLRDR
jgi:hypothetical protein